MSIYFRGLYDTTLGYTYRSQARPFKKRSANKLWSFIRQVLKRTYKFLGKQLRDTLRRLKNKKTILKTDTCIIMRVLLTEKGSKCDCFQRELFNVFIKCLHRENYATNE